VPDRPPSPFIPVAEALRRITFTVLVPDWLPTGWRLLPYCACNDTRGLFPPFVMLTYRPDLPHQNMVVHQMAVDDAPRIYGGLPDDDTWQEVDGTPPVKVTPANKWLQARAHLTRDGTFAYLTSQGITTDDLVMIAASLRPAPETGGA
jgi:hypothetical protein